MQPENLQSRTTAFTSFPALREEICTYLEDQLIDQIGGRGQQDTPVRILYIDMCAMVERDFLYPFVQSLIKKHQRSVELTLIIDKSLVNTAEDDEPEGDFLNRKQCLIDSLSSFIKSIASRGAEFRQKLKQSLDNVSSLKDSWPKAHNFSFELQFSDFDIPDSITNLEEDQKFDFIFIPFVLQKVLNWRESAYQLLSALKNKSGSIIFTEVIGDKKSMIGGYAAHKQGANQVELRKLNQFFNSFRNIRNQYFYWQPEISTYDMQAMEDFCFYLFEESNSNPFSIQRNTEFNNLKDIIQKYVRKKVISYYQFGLEDGKVEDRNLQKLFRRTHWNGTQTVSDGVKLIIFKGFNSKIFSKHNHRDWKPNRLITKIQQLSSNENTVRDIGRKILDLLLSHDMIIPNRTSYIGIMPWNIQGEDWGYPLQLAINLKGQEKEQGQHKDYTSQQLKSKYFKYLCFERAINFSIHRFIFLEQEEKYVIRINFRSEEDSYYDKEGKQEKLPPLFCPKYNERNEIEELEIQIPYWYKARAKEYIKIAKGYDGHEVQYPDDERKFVEEFEEVDQLFKKVWIKKETLMRLSISQELIDAFAKHYDYKCELTDSRLEKFNDYPQFPEGSSFDIDGAQKYYEYVSYEMFKVNDGKKYPHTFYSKLVDALYGIASIFDFNEEIILYPSAIIQEESQMKGFGGIMVLERKEEKQQAQSAHLYAARNNLLKIITNVIFTKLGIQDWVSKPYREHSLKAAIATVISRNGSHGLGSHVLSNVANGVGTVTNYNTLTQYIHQRLDFVAQVASEMPKWTIPVWFTGDLMMRFYAQKFILDTLLATEGVRAYPHFIEGGTVKEIVLPEVNDEDVEDYLNESIMLYGKMLHVTAEEIFLLQKGNSEIQVIICSFKQSFQSSKERLAQFTQALQKKKALLFNREIKIRGILRKIRGQYYLEASQIVDAQLVLKIRRRKFLRTIDKPDGRYPDIVESTSSEYMNQSHEAIRITSEFVSPKEQRREKIYGVVEAFTNTSTQVTAIYLMAAGSALKKEKRDKNGTLKCILNSREDVQRKNKLILAFPVGEKGRLSSKYKPIEKGDRIVVEGNMVIDSNGKVVELEDCEVIERVTTKYIIGSRIDLNTKARLADDIQVAIPGGLAGYQAFYTLIENIVRNSAKHSWSKLSDFERFGKNLEIKIELEEVKNTEYIICRIWNNVNNLILENQQLEYLIDSWNEKEYQLYKLENPKTPTDHVPIHRMINYMLCRSLVDEKGKLRKENLGIAEMKVSSGYLSNQEINVIGSGKEDQILFKGITNEWSGFIRARLMWEVENEALIPRLGYKLKLLKPREVGIISEKFDTWFHSQSALRASNAKKGKKASQDKTKELPFSNETDFNIKIIKHNSLESFDFEFMVIADDAETTSSSNELIKMLYELLQAKASNTIKAILKQFYIAIETYPYRLFIISDHLSQKEIREEIRKKCSVPKNSYSFIEKRIVFKSFKDDFGDSFKKLIKYPEVPLLTSHFEYFKLVLYIWWIDHLSRNHIAQDQQKRKKYGLRVHVGENQDAGMEMATNAEVNYLELLHRRLKTELIDELKRIIEQYKPNVIAKPTYQLTAEQFDACKKQYISRLSNIRNEEIISAYDINDSLKNQFLMSWHNLAKIDQLAAVDSEGNSESAVFSRWVNALIKGRIPFLTDFEEFIYEKSRSFQKLSKHPLEQVETLPRIFSSAAKKDTRFHEDWEKYLIKYIKDYDYIGYQSKQDKSAKAIENHRYFGISGKDIDINYLNSSKEVNPDTDHIISYNRHGEFGQNKEWKGVPIIYEEALSGSQIFFSILKDPPNQPYLFNKLVLQLIENAFPRILIMDERVENYVKVHTQTHQRLNNTNIYVAHQLIIDEEMSEASEQESQLGMIRAIGENCRYTISYHENEAPKIKASEFTTLVIHYGIVEKMFDKDKDEINRFFYCIKNYIPSVIVTSGRGKPGYISEFVKFLAYSNIENFILKPFPEKLLLSQILLKAININYGNR